MRARLLFISVCLIAAFPGCGDDKGGGSSDAKQTKVSADAYPAVQKFVASNIKLEDYGPVCDELAAHKEDRVAAVSEPTCRKLLALSTKLGAATKLIAKCKNTDCVADRMGPSLESYLSSFGDALRSQNSELAGVLEPGPCLTALQTAQKDLDNLEQALQDLPAAIKRFRGGATNALDDLFKGAFSMPDPTPCKT